MDPSAAGSVLDKKGIRIQQGQARYDGAAGGSVQVRAEDRRRDIPELGFI